MQHKNKDDDAEPIQNENKSDRKKPKGGKKPAASDNEDENETNDIPIQNENKSDRKKPKGGKKTAASDNEDENETNDIPIQKEVQQGKKFILSMLLLFFFLI